MLKYYISILLPLNMYVLCNPQEYDTIIRWFKENNNKLIIVIIMQFTAQLIVTNLQDKLIKKEASGFRV